MKQVIAKDFSLSPMSLFIHRGHKQNLPGGIKHAKLIGSVALEISYKAQSTYPIEIYSDHLSPSQMFNLKIAQPVHLQGTCERDYLAELSAKSSPTVSVWEGSYRMLEESCLRRERANYKEVLTEQWLDFYPQGPLPYHDLIVEEKAGHFARLSLQRSSYRDWQKEGYTGDMGYAVVGLVSQTEGPHNIHWARFEIEGRATDLNFARSFFSLIQDKVSELGHTMNWQNPNTAIWLETDNDLFLQILGNFGLNPGVTVRAPQISLGYQPIATLASCLQNFESQVFVHVHGAKEVDIAVIN